MKIINIETFPVPPRWLFVRVDTDEGITGWGEPVIEGRAETVRAAVGELSDYLIGTDPLRIEHHWQVLTKGGFYRGGPILSSAVAGLDQALWDIAGKFHGVPVYELLGGLVRDKVRMYSWIGGDDPHDLVEAAHAQIEAGFTAVKMNASGPMAPIETPARIRKLVEQVSAVREAIGETRDIVLDFHGRISKSLARRVLPLLDPLALLFVEEPVLPEFSQDLSELTTCSPVPLATGERLYSRWDFRDVLPTGIAVAQPDLSHAGGISETRRIAAMAETYDVAVAPHCPLGPIALASSLQIAFSIPNFLIQEQSLGIHYNETCDLLDYLVDPTPFRFVDGMANPPADAGLGIALNEEAIREAAEIGHRWRNPVWFRPDGSFTEW